MPRSYSNRAAASHSVLICSTSAQEAEAVGRLLAHEGYRSDLALSPFQAVEKITSASFKAAILLVQANDQSWIESIPVINDLFPHLPIVIVADTDSLEMERLARRGKIFYYLLKPIDIMELMAVLHDAAERMSDE